MAEQGQQLVSELVHEFTNAITAVIGYSELALDGVEESHPARVWLEKVGTHSRQLVFVEQIDRSQAVTAASKHRLESNKNGPLSGSAQVPYSADFASWKLRKRGSVPEGEFVLHPRRNRAFPVAASV